LAPADITGGWHRDFDGRRKIYPTKKLPSAMIIFDQQAYFDDIYIPSFARELNPMH
jgi:hypothetical protein